MKLQDVATNLAVLTTAVTALFAFMGIVASLSIGFYFNLRKSYDRGRREWLKEKEKLQAGHEQNKEVVVSNKARLDEHAEQIKQLSQTVNMTMGSNTMTNDNRIGNGKNVPPSV